MLPGSVGWELGQDAVGMLCLYSVGLGPQVVRLKLGMT